MGFNNKNLEIWLLLTRVRLLVRVYFYTESDAGAMKNLERVSRAALYTIYELVWEMEFKNIINPGRVWLKFKEERCPFGVSLKSSRKHSSIAAGDIIRIVDDHYLVVDVGVKKIDIADN